MYVCLCVQQGSSGHLLPLGTFHICITSSYSNYNTHFHESCRDLGIYIYIYM